MFMFLKKGEKGLGEGSSGCFCGGIEKGSFWLPFKVDLCDQTVLLGFFVSDF